MARRLRTAVRGALAAALVAGAGVLTPIVTATLSSTPAAAESLTPVVTGVPYNPTAMCTGTAAMSGDIFIGDGNGDVEVWSPSGGDIYGTTVPADTLTTLYTAGGQINGLTYFDDSLWISLSGGEEGGAVQVLSGASGTYYGVPYTADTPMTIISSISNPGQVAFDVHDNLYVGSIGVTAGSGSVDVDPYSSGTLFGHSVTADTVTPIVTGLNQPDGVAVDSDGNLYYGDESANQVGVLPVSSGTIFGTPVTADTPTELFGGYSGITGPSPFDAGQMEFDPTTGNLYVLALYSGSVAAISNTTGTYFGTPVTADSPTTLDLQIGQLSAFALDSSGDLYLGDGEDNAVVQATTNTADVTGVDFSGSLDNPTITITGTGFGSEPASVPPGCGATGSDYSYSTFDITDLTQGDWQAGVPGDCIGFNVVSYSSTQVTATFGSWYTDQEVGGGTQIHVGDTVIVGLAGSYISVTVPGVTAISPDSGPASGATTVNISGAGFTGATAVDFGLNPATTFTVNSDTSITATAPAGTVGPVDVTVATPGGTTTTGPADVFTYYPDVSATYSSAVPGLGATSFPVAVAESPTPPSSQTAGATFQEDLAEQVTVPSSAVNYFLGQGASALTVESQAATENGLASADGSPSGAVNPSSETASATDVPQTYPLTSDTSVTYQTTYDPVTWQTGPGTGTVYLTPGDIDIVVTYVVSGTPTTETVPCTPPPTVGTLDTTMVNPATSTPSYGVPTSSPPVANQVSAGTDDGWTVTVTNTSTQAVTGLQTQVTVGDGDATPPSFDTTAIAHSGTTGCTVTSPGVLTCTDASLAVGASDTINALVETTGLAQGTDVTGTAAVTSSNAGSASDTLDQFSLVVVNNGIEGAATPGVKITSSTAPLSQSGGAVTLKLPKKVPAGMGPMDPAGGSNAKSKKVIGPEVGLTLESLPASDEPALCPPAEGGCPGDVVVVEGNFSSYVSQADPVSAKIEIYFGNSVPAGGSMYMLKPSGTVVELAACVKTGVDYKTPCVKGKPKTIGKSGDLSSEATVLFTGNDPGFTFR